MKKTIFTGSAVAIVTPMNEDGSINYDNFADRIEEQIAGGTDAIVVCGTTGESAAMTDEEHKECIRFCVEKVAKRVPVIAGAGSNDTAYAIQLSKEAEALGVKIVTNVVIGRSMSIDDLFDDGFEAVYIGSGAGLPRFMGIPGESLKEVYSANEYLTRVNLMKAYQPGSTTPIYHARKVAVVGGGNVAMDAARSAIRLGAEEVYVLYRRSFEEIPARQEEVQHAQEEQIRFQTLTNPVEILGSDDGNVTGVRCIRMELGEPDATGRRRPVPVPDSDFVIDADCVIMAIGTSPNPLIKSTTDGLEVNARGGIVADENGCTSRDGVFAGGDTVTGAATVIKAMGAGKIAAKSIDAYIQNK